MQEKLEYTGIMLQSQCVNGSKKSFISVRLYLLARIEREILIFTDSECEGPALESPLSSRQDIPLLMTKANGELHGET